MVPGWPAGGSGVVRPRSSQAFGSHGWAWSDAAHVAAARFPARKGQLTLVYRFQAVLVPGPFSVGHNEVVFQVLVRGSAAGAFEEGGDQLLGRLAFGCPGGLATGGHAGR